MKIIFAVLLLSLMGCNLDEQICFWKQHRQDVKPIATKPTQTKPAKLIPETKPVGETEDGNVPAPDFSVDPNDANQPVGVIVAAKETFSFSMTNTEWTIIISLFIAVLIIALVVRKKAKSKPW